MLTETIKYEDFDGKTVTETLNFNITKTELADNLALQTRFEGLQQRFSGETRELTMAEVQELLDLVKTFMKLSYGVKERKDDRVLFRKTEEVWEDFKASAAYDAFLFSLFDNPEKANDFLLGILPADLRADAEKEIAKRENDVPVAPAVEPESPVAEPSDEELLAMDPKNMSHDQLQRAFALKLKS